MGYIAREVVVGTVLPPIIPSLIKLVPVVLSLLGTTLAFLSYNTLSGFKMFLPKIKPQTVVNLFNPAIYTF